MTDKSNGYEALAEEFIRARDPSIGPATVLNWSKRLQPGASILDIGCGHGVPISAALIQQGFVLYGVDASSALVAKFRERFPHVTVECSSVEESAFFNCTFDAIVAWGLMFLLPADTQRSVIGKIARSLNRPGHLLFTAPRQSCSWLDAMTGQLSISLGHDVYEHELEAHGLVLAGNDEDDGGNYYYFATKA